MSKSLYAQKMARLSARIFGEVARPTDKKSMRVVKMFSEKPIYERPDVVKYYVENEQEMKKLFEHLAYNGLYRDDYAEFKKYILEERRKMGKLKEKKEKKEKT